MAIIMTLVKKIAVLIPIALLVGCTSFLFQPQLLHYMSPDVIGTAYEDIVIKSSDGTRLHGWKLLAERNTNGSILFFHGNAENISTHFKNVNWLTRQGFDVYLFDYRGYGKSGGVAQLDSIILDIETIISYTVRQIPVNQSLAVIGHSIGGSLAIYGVAKSSYRERIRLLITVESFGDYHDATQDVLSLNWISWLFQWPLSFTVDNAYRPLDVVSEIAPIPLMLVHSTQDKVIPYYHAEALFAKAGEPKKLLLVEGTHVDVFNISDNRKLLLKYLKKEW